MTIMVSDLKKFIWVVITTNPDDLDFTKSVINNLTHHDLLWKYKKALKGRYRDGKTIEIMIYDDKTLEHFNTFIFPHLVNSNLA